MTFVKTMLGALALCAALLLWAGYAAGPVRRGLEPPPGLTAAAVLASDGMAPDGRPDDPPVRGGVLGPLAGAADAGGPAG